MEIALCSGYDSQRSFSRGFKNLYKDSPAVFRKRKDFLPLQLKYDVQRREELRADRIQDVKIINSGQIKLVGYRESTKKGFRVIGKCWRILHKNKSKICSRTDPAYLIGIDDYSSQEQSCENPDFNYIAAAQVDTFTRIPEGMRCFTLPPSTYVVFSFRGKTEDSFQPIVEYIYQEWFPHSTCHFNENNRYDLVKYGEAADENGLSDIQFWVPIRS